MLIPLTFISNFLISFEILLLGINTFSKPNFVASAMRCSMDATALTSPVNPTSPMIHVFVQSGTSRKDQTKAAAIPKSQAVSSMLIPPAILTNTSLQLKFNPIRFSKTASIICSRLNGKPVALRCGMP